MRSDFFIVDSYASIDFRYILSKNAHFSFARIASFLNIGRRGTIAITSVIALQMTRGDWGTLGLIVCVPIFLGIVSMTRLLFIVKGMPSLLLNKQACLSEESQGYGGEERASIHIHALALYLFAFNFFFGANGLMVIKAIAIYHLDFYTINPLTVFYASFVFANILTMIYPKLAERCSDWKSICMLFVMTALFCIGYWIFRNQILMFMTAALLLGVVYALQTTCIFVKLYQTIKGSNQTNYLAQIDTVSKCGFIASQISVGLMLDTEFDPLLLSATYGLAALMALGVYLIWLNKSFVLGMILR